jgi:hypothetical protein
MANTTTMAGINTLTRRPITSLKRSMVRSTILINRIFRADDSVGHSS